MTAAPTLGLAVSGGPDSLALLLIASAQEPVRVATVDHGLRPESRAEAEYVAAICVERDIPHDILAVDLASKAGQAEAREARYAALRRWCTGHGLTRLATAHHIDDQAETLLMRLARGAGLSGLAGIRAERALCPGIALERPLLQLRKSELEAIVSEAGLTPVQDPSNTDVRYDRTAFRTLLNSSDLLDPARLAQSAANLSQAEDALAWATERVQAERVGDDGSFDPRALPPEILRRLLIKLFAAHGVAPRGPELSRLIDSALCGHSNTLGNMKLVVGARWRLIKAPARRSDLFLGSNKRAT